MTESYVCPHCGRVEDRAYRVRFIIFTCPDCGENGRFLNEALVDRLDEVPESERPEGWAEMPLDERLRYAVEEDLLNVSFTGPLEGA
ncbi:MAG: hypothetical protein ABEJ97_04960 [Halobellus sp.]